ncbi:MAG: heavy-metal-associated domain-containing protein [Armatimonadetes bacterium]|nr:heavy-metal-associated domain-containing protein [Armatimonadota bacterium]
MRSGIAQVKGTEQVSVDFGTGRATLKYSINSRPLEDLIKGVKDAGSRFDATLLLQSEKADVSPAAWKEARKAIVSLKGVKSVSEPDNKGVIAITLTLKGKTTLEGVLKAAKGAGVSLRNPRPAK